MKQWSLIDAMKFKAVNIWRRKRQMRQLASHSCICKKIELAHFRQLPKVLYQSSIRRKDDGAARVRE